MSISVIIPTLNASQLLPRLLERLFDQIKIPDQVIVIDSSSSDGTHAICKDWGCELLVIPRQDFRHGKARNLAARKARGDILVFLTQDVSPIDQSFLKNLTGPIQREEAIASNARQIARPESGILEKFSRHYNYPETSFIRSASDIDQLGIKALFYSDSASAVKRDKFWEVGGFSESVIVNEDMFLCAALLRAGYKVIYQADACVYHSHSYSLKSLFQRYFNIGLFFAQANLFLHGVKLGGEGARFVWQAVQLLINQQMYHLLPRLFAETIVKWIGFHLGRRHNLLPLGFKKQCSGLPFDW